MLQSDEEDDSESGSDSSDSDEEEEEKVEAAPSKKRKADDEAVDTSAKKAKTDEKPATLWVGNLGWGVDDDRLFEEFKVAGEVVSARVVTDKESGRSRGFGYVDFSNGEEAEKAYNQLNGASVDGRELRLDFSDKRPDGNSGNNRDRVNDRAQKYGDSVSPESDTLFVGNLPFSADEEAVSTFFNSVATVTSLRLPTDMYVPMEMQIILASIANHSCTGRLNAPRASVTSHSRLLRMRRPRSASSMVPS